MNGDDASAPGPAFLDTFLQSLDKLKFLTISRGNAHIPFNDDFVVCPNLAKQAQGAGAIKRRGKEHVNSEQVIKRWNDVVKTEGFDAITSREFKRFCWTPAVAGSLEFQTLLYKKKFALTFPALRGLLYCYHYNFPDLFKNSYLQIILKEQISRRAPFKELARRWNKHIDGVIGETAPRIFANFTKDKWASPKAVLEYFDLDLTTAFAAQVVSAMVELSAIHFERESFDNVKKIITNILCFPLVSPQDLKGALSKVVVAKNAKAERQIQELILNNFLPFENLKDPRIYPENWVGVTEEARKQVVQWLSVDDIKFFFELLLKGKPDHHGRKAFWLKFADKVQRSQALISNEDLGRHSVKLQELKEGGRRYGRLTNSVDVNSFVLDFGSVVFVETAAYGHACYVYASKRFAIKFPDFWIDSCYLSDIKDKDFARTTISHSSGWEEKATNILASFGVRRAQST